VCGFPCSTWVSLCADTYTVSGGGIQFCGWPDGLPLIEQEQVVTSILKLVCSELIKEMNDAST